MQIATKSAATPAGTTTQMDPKKADWIPVSSGNGEGKIAQDWTFDTKSLNGIDNGSETGEITFFIRINDKGNVTEIRIDRKNVSGTLAAKYMRLIRTARFYPKSDGISRGASGFKTIKIVPTN